MFLYGASNVHFWALGRKCNKTAWKLSSLVVLVIMNFCRSMSHDYCTEVFVSRLVYILFEHLQLHTYLCVHTIANSIMPASEYSSPCNQGAT